LGFSSVGLGLGFSIRVRVRFRVRVGVQCSRGVDTVVLGLGLLLGLGLGFSTHAGPVQWRVRYWTPPPQDREQLPNKLQLAQPPSCLRRSGVRLRQ
jgi:hypothetical protein